MTCARAAVGLGEEVVTRWYRVRRVDRPGVFYYLVLFGEPGATISVAVVNAASCDVENWARSDGTCDHLQVSSFEARRLADLGDEASAELVWQPSAASRSPLYPLWEVRTPEAARYVDQQRTVWREL